jgi:gamma-glutamylcyclotransferase (GGCT)/AIG2-like uncharacterized protein YtfP
MESKKDYIFVYGLFRDQAKSLLGDAEYCGRHHISGKLYKVNEFYPGFIRSDSGKVWGDIYLFNSDLLIGMDDYEGEEYSRIKVMTSSDIECWVYEYKYNVSNLPEIKSGDWYLR